MKKSTLKSQKLDSLLAIYQDHPFRWRDFFFLFLPASCAVLAPLIYGYWQGWNARFQFGPAATQRWQLPWFALSAIGLIALLGLGIKRVQSAHRKIKFYKNGLEIYGIRGFHRSILWNEIRGVSSVTLLDRFLGIKVQTLHQVVLYLSDEETIEMDYHIANLDELAARIKAKIHPKRLSEFRDALKANQTLKFGAINLNSTMFKIKGKSIQWDHIKTINMRAGFLVVELKNKSSEKIAVQQVPNIEILLQLIQEGVDA